jgi:NAD(P)-dependent dehydrogenase (short-subunit alcohol dehydrogenase family)
MAEFDNRVVVVTGASGNLGQAVVRAFVAEGAKVASLGRSGRVDLTDPRRAGAAIEDVIKAHGRLDILVAAAAAAKSAGAGMGAYTASKAGVIKLTESLADELRSRGVTVNAILPGTIDTPQNRADMPAADRSRWVQPESIAGVILFLASARAADVTGAALPVG